MSFIRNRILALEKRNIANPKWFQSFDSILKYNKKDLLSERDYYNSLMQDAENKSSYKKGNMAVVSIIVSLIICLITILSTFVLNFCILSIEKEPEEISVILNSVTSFLLDISNVWAYIIIGIVAFALLYSIVTCCKNGYNRKKVIYCKIKLSELALIESSSEKKLDSKKYN